MFAYFLQYDLLFSYENNQLLDNRIFFIPFICGIGTKKAQTHKSDDSNRGDQGSAKCSDYRGLD